MFARKTHLIYLLLIFVLFQNCDNSESSYAKISSEEQNKLNQDSINSILESLYAEDKAKEFDKYFNQLHKSGRLNGNVLIAQKGLVIYEKSFGYSDLRKKDSLTLNHGFQIASVSKQFTAVAILQLYEKGLIDLNDSVQKYFPDFPYKGIDIHMLLVHRSGLPNYIYLCDKMYHDKDTGVVSNSFAMDCMTNNPPAKYYTPDTRFNYSNSGYMVLASIVEKVSNMSFDEYMDKNIFKPLGMTDTYIYVKNKTKQPANTAKGYKYRRVEAEDVFLNGVTGDKGVYSTVGDLLKWDQALYDDKIIKPSTISMAFLPMGKKIGAKKNYGYGWRMYDSPIAGKVLYHAGWWYGYQSLLVRIPKDESTIVVLRNRKTKQIIDQSALFNILYKKRELSGKSSI